MINGITIKNFLEEKYYFYNKSTFIEKDPVFIPHQYDTKEDIEISGFLAASLAWGQRKTIISKGLTLLKLMDNSPYEFLINATPAEMKHFKYFKHRTFNGSDCLYFMKALQSICRKFGSIGTVFTSFYSEFDNIERTIIEFRNLFFSFDPPERVLKHVAKIDNGSAGKRINMFLRWMVRNEGPVDFGLWKSIPPAALYIPLDLHTGNVSRKLDLLKRKQNDWKAVVELSSKLREFDSNDPVKYDYALFGLGIYERF